MTVLHTADTVMEGWIKIVEHLDQQPDDIDFNVMLDIAQPLNVPKQQWPGYKLVDQFLKKGNVQPLETVANTIFPDGLYRKKGIKGLFEAYPDLVYPRIKPAKENKWGTYFHRMVRRTGHDGKPFNPLFGVMSRLADGVKSKTPMRARYELNVLDMFADLSTSDPGLSGDTYLMGGPCLSHLSFKLRPSGHISLTAFYRSHYYMERALGNFIGLSNLLKFVSKEAGAQAGSLTIISSYAKLDCGDGWGIVDARSLVKQCKALV